jgi:hypothetical protein
MQALVLLPYALVAAIAAAAVLHHGFEDNLIQRVGLSGICTGAALKVATLLQSSQDPNQSCTVLAYGVAIYGVGTVIKFHYWRRR